MNDKTKSLILIHVSVFLFGLSGIFGKLLDLNPIIIVLGRVGFATIFLAALLSIFKESIKLNRKKDYFILALSGIILAVHWITFFKSIQMSTVTIGILTYSIFPMFTTFLEPIFFKKTLKLANVILAFITMLGVALVIPSFEIDSNTTQGALWGVSSGLSFSILMLLNKKYAKSYSSLVITFYQDFWATVVLIPFLFILNPSIQQSDMLYLILLGIVFTALAHTFFIKGLANIDAQKASIIASLEPVYGILFAVFLINEVPSLRTILGGVIIILVAGYASVQSKASE
ncbi:MAG: EamA family transporter [Flavobacteriales bacterium]|nr:EamA family transporter [Flavobacteriales bacterium]